MTMVDGGLLAVGGTMDGMRDGLLSKLDIYSVTEVDLSLYGSARTQSDDA